MNDQVVAQGVCGGGGGGGAGLKEGDVVKKIYIYIHSVTFACSFLCYGKAILIQTH